MAKGQINKRLFFTFFLLLIAVYCLLLTQGKPAEGAVEAVGRFTQTEGKVDILRGGELPAVSVKKGDQVFVKDIVRTKSDSKAEILFSDGNVLRLAQRTRIDISEYTTEGANSKEVIKLPRGKVEAVIEKKAAQRVAVAPQSNHFEIHTPNAVAGVRGTKFFVFHSIITGVLVKEGVVYVFNPEFPDTVIPVDAGKFTSIADKEQPKKPTPVTEEQIKGHDKDVASSKETTGDKGKADSDKGGSSGSGQQGTTGSDKQTDSSTGKVDKTDSGNNNLTDVNKQGDTSADNKADSGTGAQVQVATNNQADAGSGSAGTGNPGSGNLGSGSESGKPAGGNQMTSTNMQSAAYNSSVDTRSASAPSMPVTQTVFTPDTTGNPPLPPAPTVVIIPEVPVVTIPSVEVGRTTLTGAIVGGAQADMNYLSVNMKDVIFLAPSNGAKPSLWSTNNISGAYKFGPHLNDGNITGKGIALSNGRGLDANFKFNQFGSNWAANVNGSGNLNGGSYNGPVNFNGTASGTAGGGSFSGTGKGDVR